MKWHCHMSLRCESISGRRTFADHFDKTLLYTIGYDALQGAVAYLCSYCIIHLYSLGKRMIMQIL